MSIPADLKYSRDHEWAKVSGQTVTVGITDHAQNSLGDIVYTDLPKVGRALKKGETFGVVESIKAVSDLLSPVIGTVLEVNSALADDPARINREPYECWMIRVQVTDMASLEDLMDAEAYKNYVKTP
jgi:glycine cleavage system H protein